MIYFALTVLALKTFGHILNALGVKFEKKTEKKESTWFVRLLVESTFITAYLYILSHFITLK